MNFDKYTLWYSACISLCGSLRLMHLKFGINVCVRQRFYTAEDLMRRLDVFIGDDVCRSTIARRVRRIQLHFFCAFCAICFAYFALKPAKYNLGSTHTQK